MSDHLIGDTWRSNAINGAWDTIKRQLTAHGRLVPDTATLQIAFS
jgi:hypothetical protein